MSVSIPIMPLYAGATTAQTTSGSSVLAGQNVTAVDRSITIPNSVRLYSLGIYLSAATAACKLKVVQRTAALAETTVFDVAINHPGGSVFVDYQISQGFFIPASGTFYMAAFIATGQPNMPLVGSIARAYAFGDQLGSWTAAAEDTSNAEIMRYTLALP